MIDILRGVRSAALGNARDVFVYLPPRYDATHGPYPVVYLHDGQHAFAAAGLEPSWRLDETLDALITAGTLPPLVAVGVSNAGDARGAEYSHVAPYPRDPRARLAGESYEDFLIEELMPLIRSRYAVTGAAGRTAVMGSSMGGLVSYHLAFRRPEVFGLVAIMSPFLVFVDPQTLEETPVYRRFAERGPRRVWLDIGGMEGLITVHHARELAEQLVGLGYTPDAELRYRHEPAAPHHESAWATRAASALLHLFGTEGPPVELPDAAPDAATADATADAEVVAVGQAVDVAPLALRADGCAYSALGASLAWDPEPLLKPVGTALLTPTAPGLARVRATAGGLTVERELSVVAGEPTATLDVTVVTPPGTPEGDTVYFSGLVTTRIAPGVHHGVWRLPRGLGLNGSVGRGWRCDGLDSDGLPVGEPLRHDRDRRLVVHVHGWSDPRAQHDPHQGTDGS
ncbi:putative alpha/beta superfamily hydrolase [Nonomuraea muscovyensis]|uniref:Putative alpha/beta superfamily hydrolase n=1 Tax=Nonomuraea muscovyensis TaxID=1124761 RepID=A0A7X0F2N1_9ACTN|nr:alpha/beta hydrolase-fold protein [Nonomuraea muscovyensis]MBB6350825.1 putative alpha/beta superfamily hydrolase [Nonomuraea muscovyensis]